MFVYGIKEDMPLVLMVREDEPGRVLKEAVLKKCPKFPSFFTLLHRGRKVHTHIKQRSQITGRISLVFLERSWLVFKG